MLPKQFKRMVSKSDVPICGSAPFVHAFNFGNVNPHSDTEPVPALLGYYHGPFENAGKGGELVVPEIGLEVQPRPRDQIFLVILHFDLQLLFQDSILYHWVGIFFGPRFNSTTYDSPISENAHLERGFEWFKEKFFGLFHQLN